MKSIIVHDTIGGTNVNVEIPSGLSIIYQDSGTGKSYMFKLLTAYFLSRSIPYLLIDSHTVGDGKIDPSTILTMCSGKKAVLLDDANLYITDDLLKGICDRVPYVVMNIKDSTLSFGGVMSKVLLCCIRRQ